MSSLQIPESLIGIPLFVPDAHNFFEINTGAMPNGDDCLRVRGDISRDYKAFQEPQITTPAIFTDHSAIGWAMTVWLMIEDATSNLTNASFAQTFFAIENANPGKTDAESPYGGVSADGSVLWGLFAKGTTGARFSRFSPNVTGSGGAPQADTGNLGTNTWTMLTFNCATTVLGSMFINDDATAVSSGTGVSFGGGTAAIDRYFCIGAYGDNANHNGREGKWNIGKLAFHDHQLNNTERALLYNAMVN